MLRTEDDIRRALDVEPDAQALIRLRGLVDALSADRSTTPPLPAAGRPAGRRRLLPVLVGAAVVAASLGVASYLDGSGGTRSGTTGGSALTPAGPPLTWDMAVDPVPGYTVNRGYANRQGAGAGSLAVVTARSGERPERGFIVSCAGPTTTCFKAPDAAAGPVTIGGRSGSFYPGRHVARNGLLENLYRQPWTAAYDGNEFQPQLVWRPDADTTVVISGTFGFDPTTYGYDNAAAKATLMRLARAVSVGRHDPIHVPFALRHLPAGIWLESVMLTRGQHCIGYGTGANRGEWVGSVLTACRVPTGASRAATIRAADAIDPTETDGVAVHDFPDGTSVVVEVDAGKKGVVSTGEARKLAAGADVSPRLADPSSWIVVH